MRHILAMKRTALFRSLALLSLTVVFARGQEWDCQTPACEGHKAGYNWALRHDVTDRDCDTAGEHTNSPSFAEGCKTAVQMQRLAAQRFAEARAQIAPLVQEYLLGKQLAKETRALPSDCEEAYKSLVESTGDTVLPTCFRTGCLEVAKKQAKRIIKEDAKRAKEAEQQAKRQEEAARSAAKTR